MERATPVLGGRRRGRRSLWPLVLLLAALALAACGGGSDGGEAEPPEEPREPITLQSNDGLRFQAEVRGEGDTWVLLGHEFTGRGSDWDPIAAGFAERGYRVLSWDFRCHGDSECRSEALRDATVDIWREWEAALDYAVAQGAQTIHAGGASMGGTSLIQVAADRSDIASIFAISSPNRFQGLDALVSYERVTVPRLFVVGVGDTAAPDFSRRFHEEATGPSRLEILETELHGNTLAVDRRWGPVVQAFVYAFVAEPAGFVAAGTEPAPAAGTAQPQAPARPQAQASSTEESPAASAAPGADSLSGYVLAWLTGGEGVDSVVVADPFTPLESSLVGSYGDVIDIAWLPDGSGLAVGERETLTLVDFTADPPEGQVVLTPEVLPAGLSADFFGADFSPDGLRYILQRGPGRPGAGAVHPGHAGLHDGHAERPLRRGRGRRAAARCTLVRRRDDAAGGGGGRDRAAGPGDAGGAGAPGRADAGGRELLSGRGLRQHQLQHRVPGPVRLGAGQGGGLLRPLRQSALAGASR